MGKVTMARDADCDNTTFSIRERHVGPTAELR